MAIRTVTFTCTLALLGYALAPAEANWPQWRGPTNTGAAAADADPPTQWSESKNIRWKVKLSGSGSSTPIVWGDQIFIQTAMPASAGAAADAASAPPAAAPPEGRSREAEARGQGRGPGEGGGGRGGGGRGRPTPPSDPYRFVLLCIDRKTGKTLWEQTARELVPHEGHHRDHGFSSSSPVTDGTHVWAYFGSRGLHCYDMKGNRVWEKDLGKQSTRGGFGEGSSPSVHGDTIVINWDHEGDDFIAAFDKLTGDERWRQKRDEPTTWTTPLIVEHDGKPQVIVAGTNRVRSYDLASGKELWHCRGLTVNVIPSPVAKDGVVYLTSGFKGAAVLAIKLGREGDLTGTDSILWTRDKSAPYVPSPLLDGDKLYLFSNNNGILSCLDTKTGKPLVDTQRIDGLENVYASPAAAGGRLYFVGRDGTSVVMRLSGETLEELAVNELDDPIDASPAIIGKELFLRGRQHLYCIAE